MLSVVKELSDFQGAACLVTDGSNHWVVSSLTAAFDTGEPETLVFPANSDGRVTSWCEVAGGRHMSREEAIADLEASL